MAQPARSLRSHAFHTCRLSARGLEMKGTGQALSHGAISILNAFPTGKGGALGVDLWTRAKVSLREGPGQISGFISSDPEESNKLAVTVVQKVLEHYGYELKLQGEVITSSNIPSAVSLKSSRDYKILIRVPSRKTPTRQLDRTRFAPIRRISELAYSEASNGHIWDALTLNGLALSSILGEDPRPALSAIEAGAYGAGLSGKGPAIAAVVDENQLKPVRQ